jgi:putative sterol carrier protein
MSRALERAAEKLGEKFAAAGYTGIVEFDVEDEGIITVEHGVVRVGNSEGGAPDVTISATLDTFRAIFDGEMSPTAAFMTGRMRVRGDMATAMRLSQVLG